MALNFSSSLIALIGLLPVAGGLPAIASPAVPFANAIWFIANLGGALLLLAAGLKLIFPTTSRWFELAFTALVILAGAARLFWAGFPNLSVGWLTMAVCVGILLLLLRRFWIWAAVGGMWSGLVLGIWSYGGISIYLSLSAPQFPYLLLIQIVACVFATLVGFLNLRFRRDSTDRIADDGIATA